MPAAPQINAELDRQAEVERARTDIASSYLLSESNAKFDALEEEINALADQARASKAELQAWEEVQASARSQVRLAFMGFMWSLHC